MSNNPTYDIQCVFLPWTNTGDTILCASCFDSLLMVKPYCFLRKWHKVDPRQSKRNHLDFNFLGHVENEIILLIKIAFLQFLWLTKNDHKHFQLVPFWFWSEFLLNWVSLTTLVTFIPHFPFFFFFLMPSGTEAKGCCSCWHNSFSLWRDWLRPNAPTMAITFLLKALHICSH